MSDIAIDQIDIVLSQLRQSMSIQFQLASGQDKQSSSHRVKRNIDGNRVQYRSRLKSRSWKEYCFARYIVKLISMIRQLHDIITHFERKRAPKVCDIRHDKCH